MLIVLTLSACATQQTVPIPDWKLAERDTSHVVADPVPLPALCPLQEILTAKCAERIDVYEDVAEGNTQIAQLNANALRKTEQAYDNILDAGKLQQQLSQIRQELLEQERRAHFFDNMFYRSVIALGLLGAAL